MNYEIDPEVDSKNNIKLHICSAICNNSLKY